MREDYHEAARPTDEELERRRNKEQWYAWMEQRIETEKQLDKYRDAQRQHLSPHPDLDAGIEELLSRLAWIEGTARYFEQQWKESRPEPEFSIEDEEDVKPTVVVVYRSAHMNDGGDIRYCCQDALDTSGYNRKPGPPPAPESVPTMVCADCGKLLDAGAEVIYRND